MRTQLKFKEKSQNKKIKPKESASVNVGSRSSRSSKSSSAEAAYAANPSSLKSRKHLDVVSIYSQL